MSELMDKAVLTMPYELAMADELSRMQFWSRVQLLYKEHQAALAALRSMTAEPVAWRTFDGEGQYDYRSFDENENYREAFEARNPNHVGWVEPLYLATPPTEPVEGESYEELWNALQEIDTAAVQLPTFKILHEGGIEAVTKNIIAAIRATPPTAPVLTEAERITPGGGLPGDHNGVRAAAALAGDTGGEAAK